jgi:hypothetical protein
VKERSVVLLLQLMGGKFGRPPEKVKVFAGKVANNGIPTQAIVILLLRQLVRCVVTRERTVSMPAYCAPMRLPCAML